MHAAELILIQSIISVVFRRSALIDNIIRSGSLSIFHADEFLPEVIRDSFYDYALERLHAFTSLPQRLSDPEYTAVKVLQDIGEFRNLFAMTIAAAWRDVALSLGTSVVTPSGFQFQLTMLCQGAYRKPRSEALHGNARGSLSFIYALGRQPKQYSGGVMTFYDHNPYVHPYERNAPKFTRRLEFPATPNSLIIFPSSSFYSMSDISPLAPNSLNACLLLDGSSF